LEDDLAIFDAAPAGAAGFELADKLGQRYVSAIYAVDEGNLPPPLTFLDADSDPLLAFGQLLAAAYFLWQTTEGTDLRHGTPRLMVDTGWDVHPIKTYGGIGGRAGVWFGY